ncbi:MAG TPA: sporulation protein YqfC [Sphingobacteriaceae bacterium]|nr:sporulation protein YqfC [Sphingobacteriaceae bacterium]
MPKPPLRSRLAELLDMPRDVVLNLPRISVVGDLQVLVQNHRGVKEYTPERVIIGMESGLIVISGRELVISNIHVEEITITGRLDGVQLLRSQG